MRLYLISRGMRKAERRRRTESSVGGRGGVVRHCRPGRPAAVPVLVSTRRPRGTVARWPLAFVARQFSSLHCSPPPSPPTKYFVDSVTGSDANDGCSAALRWKSLTPISTAVVVPGDAVRLKRGGRWRVEAPFLVHGVGVLGKPVVYGSYGDASQPKPLLLGSRAVGGAGNWTAIPSRPGLWRTLPEGFKPSPGATERLHEPSFARGGSFWECYTTGCPANGGPCSKHVHGAVSNAAAAPAYEISFTDMAAAPTARTQFFTTNVLLPVNNYQPVNISR